MTIKEKAQAIFKEFLDGTTVYARVKEGNVVLESVGIIDNKLIGYVVNDEGLARRFDITNIEVYKMVPIAICPSEEIKTV